MKTPRKLYLVTSKKAEHKRNTDAYSLRAKRADAERLAARLNGMRYRGVDDWRVEVFVKGD